MNTSFSLDHKRLLNTLNIGVIIHGKESEVIYANYKALEIMDMTWLEMTGQIVQSADWNVVDKEKTILRKESLPVSMVMASGERVVNYELGVVNKGSVVSWMLCNAHPEFDDKGCLERVVVTLIDITGEHEDVPFKQIVDLANDVIVITDAERTPNLGHKIVYVNNAFTALTGYESGEALGRAPNMLQGEITSNDTIQRIGEALKQKKHIHERIYNYTKDGRGYWLDMNIVPLSNESGEILYFAAIERDITAQQEKEDKLSAQVNRDKLTGLLNRRGFDQVAEIAIKSALKQHFSMAFAMVDVDYFKKINDTYGHDVGDKALCELTTIMQLSFRKTDLLGRFGGEEFIIAITDCPESEALHKLNEFRDKVAKSRIEINPTTKIKLTISIGIAFLENTNNNLKALVKAADIALYRAKASGRNKVCSYIE
jgi:diguanylate cyclase (GGDEF)-like protein/PAS domain S-box-containing protein